MVKLRDTLALSLKRIIEAVIHAQPKLPIGLTMEDWNGLLSDTIEPVKGCGDVASTKLVEAFDHLPQDHQKAWAAGFECTYYEYVMVWYPSIHAACREKGIELQNLSLFGFKLADVFTVGAV